MIARRVTVAVLDGRMLEDLLQVQRTVSPSPEPGIRCGRSGRRGPLTAIAWPECGRVRTTPSRPFPWLSADDGDDYGLKMALSDLTRESVLEAIR